MRAVTDTKLIILGQTNVTSTRPASSFSACRVSAASLMSRLYEFRGQDITCKTHESMDWPMITLFSLYGQFRCSRLP